ncbi:MAG: ATP-binding protein [Candidatus Hermodarchaeota archaeon]
MSKLPFYFRRLMKKQPKKKNIDTLDHIEFARKVVPQFDNENISLSSKLDQQIQEILTAIKSSSGVTVLFVGSSGKTMTAEVLSKLSGLPLYRIDLSQVVNKYIGETEKNLERIFDSAENLDVILLLDEGDALLSQRTEVNNARDRYANLLLERMNRSKSPVILAINQKKPLDEAFERKIRYIIDFSGYQFDDDSKFRKFHTVG